MSHESYSVEDFVLDPSFRKWVLEEDASAHKYWTAYISQHPGKVEVLRKARKLLLNIPESNYIISDKQTDSIWQNILQQIENQEKAVQSMTPVVEINSASALSKKSSKTRMAIPTWLSVAAVITLAFTISFLWLRFEQKKNPAMLAGEVQPKLIQRVNGYEHRPRFFLSDGTEVILNGGSAISYYEHFSEDKREVFLEGEAYFNVVKDVNRPFYISTDQLNISVLGTEFNVRAHKNRDQVVAVAEGAVEVALMNDNNTEIKVTLLPGKGVFVKEGQKVLNEITIDYSEHFGWKEGKVMLRKADRKEVFSRLEELYGVEFKFLNQNQRKWSYTGLFVNQSLENILNSISFAMDFEYKIENKVVEIKFN
ncbi:MAG: FecR family protein [Cyclobacteriaceae bacterium]|nr:FecR family protein [Cyclobacteriaceae bacterium]